MSKGRLEEIKKDKALSNDDAVIKNSHYEWLIERVQKLEEIKSDAIKQIDVTHRRNERLEQRVEELEQDVREWGIVNEQWEKINTQIAEKNKRYREYLGRLQRATNRYPAEDMAYVVNKITSEALEGEGK